MDQTILRALVDLRDRTLQKSRIAFGNRVDAIERGVDEVDPAVAELMNHWHERFKQLEVEATKDIESLVEYYPIAIDMAELRGIGSTLAAKLVSMIDIERANTVSSLWRYAGFGLGKYWKNGNGDIVAPKAGYKYVDGERRHVVPDPRPEWELVQVRDQPVSGWLLNYNKRLKTACYLVATSFMRSGSPYREIYDSSKAYYQAERDWSDGHCHNAAQRKMTKVFLSHLWEHWRLMEGLPTRKLYVEEKLGHENIHERLDFGWPAIE